MSTDQPENATTGNNGPVTALANDDPVNHDPVNDDLVNDDLVNDDLVNDDQVIGDRLQSDHRSEAGLPVEQRDVAQAGVDPHRPFEDDDMPNPRNESLFSTGDTENLRRQWDALQTAFVDDPRVAVERADHLVVETIRTLSTSFNQERSRLEEQWARGESVSTENLRVAIRLYRSFFDRLLSI
jgi:hypothetical protein